MPQQPKPRHVRARSAPERRQHCCSGAAALLHPVQRSYDPPAPGAAPHGCSQDGACAQGLGEDEGLPGGEAGFEEEGGLGGVAGHAEACGCGWDGVVALDDWVRPGALEQCDGVGVQRVTLTNR